MNAAVRDEDRSDIDYEFIVYAEEGTAVLTMGGEVMWTSDGDDEFSAEFDDLVDVSEADAIIDWLCENDYLPPGVAVAVIEGDHEDI
jgi:hypothetical protein